MELFFEFLYFAEEWATRFGPLHFDSVMQCANAVDAKKRYPNKDVGFGKGVFKLMLQKISLSASLFAGEHQRAVRARLIAVIYQFVKCIHHRLVL